ncbi:MAG: HIT domain-containing protein [Candidatus Omnitrophica bacterium]|nr:HIT domain-containing protein [Candidatus Omnitrophota bacterium]MCM8790296.1 HIT domain-containing protein [Candidatus Omnitrophota bacterium]
MDRLWAPWRSKYIYLRKRKKCIFCGAKNAKNPRARYILERSTHSFSMLNIYPYNNGHIMVAPYRHLSSLEFLSDAELFDLIRLVNRTKAVIDQKMKPHGYNIGWNLGKIGGAGYPGHVHVHIVPRWTGDTNFMPIVANTKIVSESLDVLYNILKKK